VDEVGKSWDEVEKSEEVMGEGLGKVEQRWGRSEKKLR
jgi:hypothetical protein